MENWSLVEFKTEVLGLEASAKFPMRLKQYKHGNRYVTEIENITLVSKEESQFNPDEPIFVVMTTKFNDFLNREVDTYWLTNSSGFEVIDLGKEIMI